MTFDYYISDIESRLTGNKPSDDLELSREQIAYLLSTVRDGLVKQRLDQKLLAGLGVDPNYVVTEEFAQVDIEDMSGLDDCKDYTYVELSKQPITLVKDMGIVEVTTQDFDSVTRVEQHHLTSMRSMKFTRPSSDNMYFWRKNKRLYIEGLDKATLELTQLIVTYVPSYAQNIPADGDNFFIEPDLAALMLDTVAQKLAQQLGIHDVTNDSTDATIANKG